MHKSRSGKKLEDQIHNMLDKVLHDEDLKGDCIVHYIDEEEPSFLESGLNTKNQITNKFDKFRSKKHLEDLNYLHSISSSLSTCNSAISNNRNNSLNLYELSDEIMFTEQGIESLINENPIDLFEEEVSNINYNNILKLGDKIDEESFIRLHQIFINIISSQNGSKTLLKCCKKTDKNILKLIIDELMTNIDKVFSNPNANEFCQELFSFIKEEERLYFMEQLKRRFCELSKCKFTSKSLYIFTTQFLNKNEKIIIVEFVKDHLIELCNVKYFYSGYICSSYC